MSSAARRLIDDALQLSAEERADIVDELIASMVAQPLDAEWTAEIERRAARALAEPDGGTPWAEVEARLRARLGST